MIKVRIILLLSISVMCQVALGQLIAGVAEHVIEVEDTLRPISFCDLDSLGEPIIYHFRESLNIDFYDDGIIDVELYAAKGYGERCKYSYRTGADMHNYDIKFCLYYQTVHPIVFEQDSLMICELDGSFWSFDGYMKIGSVDWFPSSNGYFHFVNKYLFFKSSTTDSLKGWIKVSHDVEPTKLIVHSIGMNHKIPISFNHVSQEIGSTTTSLVQDSIKLFPNPFSNQLNIDFRDNISSEIVLSFFDLSGRLIHLKQFDSATSALKIDTAFLPTGVYILQIEIEDQVFRKKLIKY